MENQSECHEEDIPRRRLLVTVDLSPNFLSFTEQLEFPPQRGETRWYYTV
ncbi:unnamed protein product [Gulo gulo]|uniref:Uncharacterized protein n=1 Tax=Gulo gulo TaxID=48420 RepID=A0A9X9M2H8_GULGU|nr:unnamed protein product [Gulo gulo]